MHRILKYLFVTVSIAVFSLKGAIAQISPGELASPHSHLEGISNCTECHVLGKKVTNEKCLECHTEIRNRVSQGKGYHSSTDVAGKECRTCHSDHHGKAFQIVRFETKNFDHKLTGYALSVPHSKKECKDCHETKFITDEKVKNKKFTWMGIGTDCLNCHADYHMKTLSSDCVVCHNPDAFKPAPGFDHSKAKFQLTGMHKKVDCLKCHKVETVEGKKFQEFKGVKFNACVNCHKDPHQNKFGQKCNDCHSVETFQIVKGMDKFDHNLTDFKLEGKHTAISCKVCHKTNYKDPLKHEHCTDCHEDYHKGQFAKNGGSVDCARCHSVKGFNLFSYTTDQHNKSKFPLEGAHLATACIKCHKKQKEWNFREIGINCHECHPDIHKTSIDTKYYPLGNCRTCHSVNRWNEISYDHAITGFALTGAHSKQTCRDCHLITDSEGVIKRDPQGIILQKFSTLSANCTECHTDVHNGQFVNNGTVACTRCHETENWKAIKFDHSKTAFKLDGQHINVQCVKCHKPLKQGTQLYINYKLKDYKCESCH